MPGEIENETDPRRPTRRYANLLFTCGDGQPNHRADWSNISRPAAEQMRLRSGFSLRDLWHYFAAVLIFGGANVKMVRLVMGHTIPTVTFSTYVGYWPDAMHQTGRSWSWHSVDRGCARGQGGVSMRR
ncbi:hypothetical protein [Prauserella muralis]|uniref:Tyr recombinase domain-containing protein n=1 Tax=Prauserella muralis TaxID=588067 RepID=A0A2V4BN93_9PSEU|nr:hypothetical protein [Prauserella muralis]PXY32103.1 hypothetical protein BAY60_07330 [Prauserella muralis]